MMMIWRLLCPNANKSLKGTPKEEFLGAWKALGNPQHLRESGLAIQESAIRGKIVHSGWQAESL